jgi:APA family basic amino acid/polyamine antiporter
MTTPAANPDALLVRGLGVRQLAANIFNYTVGSGIFVLPGVAVAMLGAAAPLAYLVCALVIGLVVLCFAQAGSRVATTGGPYAYVEVALGPLVGFMAGALVFLTGWSAAAAVTTVFVRSLLALVPGAPMWMTPVLIITTVVILVTVNLRGLKTGARVLEIVTIAKLLPLLLFVVVGVFFIEPANFQWQSTPEVSSVLATAGIVIFAFSGIEGSLIPSGEVREPWRTVPRAALIALGTATLLYLAIQYVALGILGGQLGDERTTPLANAARAALGSGAGNLLIVGAVISMFGYLTANVLSEPRGLFAFGRDRFLPRVLSQVHPTFHTPSVAIITYGFMVTGLALSGTFEQLAVFANLAALMLYFLCALAAWRLRARNVRAAGEPFDPPGGVLIPIATCVALIWLFRETAQPDQVIALLGVLFFAFLLYVVRTWRERRTSSREKHEAEAQRGA